MVKKEIWIQRPPGKKSPVLRVLEKLARVDEWLEGKGVYFWHRKPEDPSDPHGYRKFYEDVKAIHAALEREGLTQEAASAQKILDSMGGGMPSDWFEEALDQLRPMLKERGDRMSPALRKQIADMVATLRPGF